MTVHEDDAIPMTLLDLLSNHLILSHIAPYLPVKELLSLSATCKPFQFLIFDTPQIFRYLDLSDVKSAAKAFPPIDAGGEIWRSEPMDMAITEDDFYAGPLRGIFAHLSRRRILQDVQILILDGLSVPADLVREIVLESRFNVKLLSIREAKNLNERKLMQVLRYACRPTRDEGTPKLKGLYVFGPKHSEESTARPGTSRTGGLLGQNNRMSEGAQIGSQWNHRSQSALNSSVGQWYGDGKVILRQPVAEWADTIQYCQDLIAFDAILCQGPRHSYTSAATPDSDSTEFNYLHPAVATVSLGDTGCQTCQSIPEGPAVFGESPSNRFPLFAPPPLRSSTVLAAQRPPNHSDQSPARLYVRCNECLHERWCERCNKFWCESCYKATTRTNLQQVEAAIDLENSNGFDLVGEASSGPKMGIEPNRSCWECGRKCLSCAKETKRVCRFCSGSYCLDHNEGSSDTTCDWCAKSGRRTRELY